jgi:hypothetical protein
MFEIGQQVVCIADSEGRPWRFETATFVDVVASWPRYKQVYTVRGVGPSNERGTFGLYLEEIVNPEVDMRPHGIPFVGEPNFGAHHFRPVRKTSIEVFRQILVTPPKKLVDA